MPTIWTEALAAHVAEFSTGDDDSLFVTRLGSPYRTDYYGAQIFKKAVTKAKLPATTTPHDLRHHYASELLQAGESVVVVADRLGHSNATTVLKTYGHLVAGQVAGQEDRTRLAIDRLWAASSVADAHESSKTPGLIPDQS
jgi:integrase